MKYEIGDKVEKQGSSKDYCTGRIGDVIEVNEAAERARVLWHTGSPHEGGKPLTKTIRTWVKFVFLLRVKQQVS